MSEKTIGPKTDIIREKAVQMIGEYASYVIEELNRCGEQLIPKHGPAFWAGPDYATPSIIRVYLVRHKWPYAELSSGEHVDLSIWDNRISLEYKLAILSYLEQQPTKTFTGSE